MTAKQYVVVFLMVFAGVFSATAWAEEASEPGISAKAPQWPTGGYTVTCYYFPNYHVDRRNEKWHGKGWSEWELTRQAKPRFEGHRQPLVPAWGYTDEADPKQMAQKIDAAADAGIDVFLFDWYFYNDGPFLQRGLEEGFMKAPNASRMKFALMWANHNWKNLHPLKKRPPPVLLEGTITPVTWERMTDYIIRVYFKNPAHWKIDGRPYFSIYDIPTLMKSFGSVEKTALALKKFREKTVAAGFPGLHLNAIMRRWPVLPDEKVVKDRGTLVDQLGFDSVASYVWVHHVRLWDFPRTPYDEMMRKSIAYWHNAAKEFNVPYYPNVTMGWDPSPRVSQELEYAGKGYPDTPTLSGNTPAAFRKALLECRKYLDALPPHKRIMSINAWNEWTEGSYLEPDTVNGMGYLNAIRDVFGHDRKNRRAE